MKRGGPGQPGLKRRGGGPGQLTKPNSTLDAGELYQSQVSIQSQLEERSKRKIRGITGADRQQTGPNGPDADGDSDQASSEKMFCETFEKRGSSAPAKFKFNKNRQESGSAAGL